MALRSSLARLATSQGLSAPAGAPVFSASLPEAKARSRQFFREVRDAHDPRSRATPPRPTPYPETPARPLGLPRWRAETTRAARRRYLAAPPTASTPRPTSDARVL